MQPSGRLLLLLLIPKLANIHHSFGTFTMAINNFVDNCKNLPIKTIKNCGKFMLYEIQIIILY